MAMRHTPSPTAADFHNCSAELTKSSETVYGSGQQPQQVTGFFFEEAQQLQTQTDYGNRTIALRTDKTAVS
jgi:hypothetical protein